MMVYTTYTLKLKKKQKIEVDSKLINIGFFFGTYFGRHSFTISSLSLFVSIHGYIISCKEIKIFESINLPFTRMCETI